MTHRNDQHRRVSMRWLFVALISAIALVAAGCGDDNGDTEADAGGGNDAASEDKGTINIGWIPWDEDVAVTHLWKHVLEEEGYTVELTQLDVAPVYSGLAQGDVDVFLDAWLPTTHEDYWEEFGDQVEDLGVWYDQGTLELAVPSYVDADSIADLTGNASEFGGQIIGIEPGAGLMRITREGAIPTYGLDDYELVEGSTPAMLAELQRATDNEEPIVVTLWHPHWAYAAFDIKDLEDPEGAMGEAEMLHALGRTGFSDDFSEVAGWLGNFEMSDEALASLEDLMLNQFDEGEEAQAVEQWLEDEANQSMVDSWIS